MPTRLRRLVLLPLLLAMLIATPGSASGRTVARAYWLDLYWEGGYERQVDSRTCTAASTAMMMNFIARRDLNLGQLTILRYAQRRDALNDRIQRGSDPLGWSRAATYFSGVTGRPTTYAWEAYTTENSALRRAALQIARFRKPVGLLVRNGQHAMVMTGFVATRDPRLGSFSLTAVYFSDPLGTHHAVTSPANSPLSRYLELDATPTYDRAWYGKYVIVAPQN